MEDNGDYDHVEINLRIFSRTYYGFSLQMSEFVFAMKLDDLGDRSSNAVTVSGVSVLLCRNGDSIYALENRCSHNGSPLVGGAIRGNFIFCPVHAARFDMRTGCTNSSLTKVPVKVFQVKIQGSEIFISVTSKPAPINDIS